MSSQLIKPIFYSKDRKIITDERYVAAGRYHKSFIPLTKDDLIPIPEDTILFELPERKAIVFDKHLRPVMLEDRIPIAAFIPPGYTQTYLCPFIKSEKSKLILPLFSYTAVGIYKNKLYISAIHIDKDKRHSPSNFQDKEIASKGDKILKQFPSNRLFRHLVLKCALEYRCPNARNIIMNKCEAPLPVSPKCNSRCLGCISFQKSSSGVSSPQNRLDFVPDEEELFEVARYHIKNVKRPILSFGQGCEGEPLLQAELISRVIKRIRKISKSVTININTNGSNPYALKYLFECSLDSARISLNSAREELYTAYYKPIKYTFSDVIKSIEIGKKLNKWISINYFVFPGITDSESEYIHLRNLIKTYLPSMLQLRNFNIDPDWYIESCKIDRPKKVLGIKIWLKKLSEEFPFLRFGYFNPYLK